MEKVHRFACRLATNNYTARYLDLLHELHWKPLARLRVERQMLLVFKYLEGVLFRFLPDEGTLELALPQARQLSGGWSIAKSLSIQQFFTSQIIVLQEELYWAILRSISQCKNGIFFHVELR